MGSDVEAPNDLSLYICYKPSAFSPPQLDASYGFVVVNHVDASKSIKGGMPCAQTLAMHMHVLQP